MKKKTLIARYLRRGMRKVEIARKVGVSRNYVYKIIKQQEDDDELPYMAGVYDKGDY